MVVLDTILYLEISDAVKCGFGDENYIYKEKSRGAQWARFIKHPVFKKMVLIEYESLAPAKKKLVTDCFGNPYDHFAKQPIRNMVQRDHKAEAFFLEYTYGEADDLKKLPTDPKNNVVEKYTIAASWLNMLVKAQDDFKAFKKELNISAAKFWMTVGDMINSENIGIPSHQFRLREKIKDYREKGYEVLIHGQYGRSNNIKVVDEVAQSLLISLIEMPNSDDVVTCNRYNKWAVENGYKQIDKRTVCNWRKKHEWEIHGEKYGTSSNYNKFGKHIQRFRATAPLVCCEIDDNELDLYFQTPKKNKTGGVQVYYFDRFVIAVIIDTFNDYPLGWAIGETYTKELIRFAWLDAIYHIKELTGKFYLPHQIRADRFGLDKNLTNDLALFYQSLATFTPPKAKVARGKYIERSFGIKWHQALRCYKNYAGNNITSDFHVSQDFIDQNKKSYPNSEQAPDQAFHFINILRHLVIEKTGLSRQEEWINAFHASEKSKAHPISEIQLLVKLGTPHSHTNTITNRGITPAINCVDRTYEIPEEIYLQTIGKKVQVIFDPMDYSRILVTNYKDLLFIAREQELMPSAIADFKPGDRAKINDRLEEKRRHMQLVADKKKDRQEVLQRHQIDVESMLMAGIHTKAESHGILLNYSPVPIDAPPQRKPKQLTNKKQTLEDMLKQM